MTFVPVCAACARWKHKFDDQHGRGRGVCWHAVPAMITREDDHCVGFRDRIANRDEVEAWKTIDSQAIPK